MADWNWDDQDDGDEEGNEEETGGFQRWQFGTRDGLIFLIDCSKAMFIKDDEESAFEKCIRCAKTVIQNKIISSDRDFLGIVFFATESTKNPSELKHIYIFHDLCLPGAEVVLQLEAFKEKPNNDDFKKNYGHSDSYSLGDALWTCSTMFSNCKQKLGFKRVMLFTNNDSPHSNSAQLKRLASAKAEDLHQNGIDLDLMHLNKQNNVFDVSLFYKDILFSDDEDNVVLPDPSAKFEELLTRVRFKDHKKRALSRLPLSLGEGLSMAVGVYNLVRPCNIPSAVKLYKKDNTEIKSVTKTFLQETGEILMPQDTKKSLTYATKQIMLENEEVAEIKMFDKPGLMLMGFKPTSRLKKYYHVKPGQFIYPDESSVQGSGTLFTALLKKCLGRDVVAICRYIPRRNTPVRFAALWPQAEELDEQKVQVVPPGFHVLMLPFADDFRKLKFDEIETPKATANQVDKAKELIKKLQFTFHSENFENPRLQQHYANVEAMALDRDMPEKATDYTLPDEEKMDKRAGAIIEQFKELVFPEGYVAGSKKRPAKGGDGEGGTKKAKAADSAVDIDMETEAKEGRLGKLTVPILKDFIKSAKIKAGGTKKAELIEAINAHFSV